MPQSIVHLPILYLLYTSNLTVIAAFGDDTALLARDQDHKISIKTLQIAKNTTVSDRQD